MNEPSHAKVWLLLIDPNLVGQSKHWSHITRKKRVSNAETPTGSHFGAIQEPQITHIFLVLSCRSGEVSKFHSLGPRRAPFTTSWPTRPRLRTNNEGQSCGLIGPIT